MATVVDLIAEAKRSLKLHRRDQVLLLVLAAYAQGNPLAKCWPSYTRLQASSAMSRQQLFDSIRRLKDEGLIVVEECENDRRSHTYRLNITVPTCENDSEKPTVPTRENDNRSYIWERTVPTRGNISNQEVTSFEVTTKNTPQPPTGGARELNGSSATQPTMFGDEEPLNGKATDHGPAFEEFYGPYPKKVDKQEALGLWKKLNPPDRLKAIERAGLLKEWVASLNEDARAERTHFLPSPARFLRRRKWEDDHSGVHAWFVEWLKVRHRPRDTFFDEQYETDVERAARLAREGAARNGS